MTSSTRVTTAPTPGRAVFVAITLPSPPSRFGWAGLLRALIRAGLLFCWFQASDVQRAAPENVLDANAPELYIVKYFLSIGWSRRSPCTSP